MKKTQHFVTLQPRHTIKEALECLNKSGLRCVLIVDSEQKLLGIVTDGDLRRAMLAKKKLSERVSSIMNKNPISAPAYTPSAQLLDIMVRHDVLQIPLLDREKKVKSLVSLSELKRIPLSSPDITSKEVEIINEVLATPHLSIGPKIKEFEERIAAYIGMKYAIAVNSGTSGLHLCIKSLDIKDGDEVITTPFSFIASANCILFERAKPVFVDIDENTLCIDAHKIEEKITKKTKAILPVHIFGHPCEMDTIINIAKKYRLAVIEDACEAIGAEYKGRRVGSFGEAGVFGFYPNKQITTGEGGMIVTSDKAMAQLCKSMRNQGRNEGGKGTSYERLGYNYRMNELSAALGVIQISRIEEIIKKRQKVADSYNKWLEQTEGIEIPFVDSRVRMSWFVYVVRLNEKMFSEKHRDKIVSELGARGIACTANYFPPIHLEPFYVKKFGYKKGDSPIAEKVSTHAIALPFYNNLPDKEIRYICENVEATLKRL
ncbi:MAG: aminotransferase class I/II-fold pyridoxal phosphate-dependent enzyme [Candidatus Portnoybacteria bacterium]|nr:aminotransferase class I/II-fold pyridoxal phosphate-dependent enzyme [Candidatus Portnoybacteria bacterium]